LVGRITSLKSWTVDYALHKVPLSQLFLLWVENEVANGAIFADPSYEEKDDLDFVIEDVKDLKHHWRPD